MERATPPSVDSLYAVDDSTTKHLLLALRAKAILALAGDVRSLSDLLSILVLAYVNAIPKMPIVLVGKSYWEPIVEELRKTMIAADFPTASAGILDRVTITDDPRRALDAIHSPVKG